MRPGTRASALNWNGLVTLTSAFKSNSNFLDGFNKLLFKKKI